MTSSIENSLINLAREKLGHKIDQSRLDDIVSIATDLQHEYHYETLEDFLSELKKLSSNHPIWLRLINRITVGETYFFRNSYHFHALRYSVLPELIQKRRNAEFKYLNIWSAGCSTGEEPYSIAMLLTELLPDIDDWTITILATDINETSLQKARSGIYRSNSFRSETPPYLVHRYFNQEGSNYVLDERIKRMVTFNTLNLVTAPYPSFATRTMHQDIILCRNVTIYFDAKTTKQIVDGFFESLASMGWLVVGHSEPSYATYQDLQTRNYENAIFYQKLDLIPESIHQVPVSKRVTIAEKPTPKPIAPSTEEIWQALNREDWLVARHLIDNRIASGDTSAVTHYLEGLFAFYTMDLPLAFAALRRALYCDPKFIIAHFMMGEIHARQGQMLDAQQRWRKAQQLTQTLDPNVQLTGQEDITVELLRELIANRLGVSIV